MNGAVMTVSYLGSITDNFEPPMPEFEKALNGSCSGVILDLSNVEYINSVGVSSLMNTFKAMRNSQLNVVVCSPSPQVFKVLKLARTDLVVPVADNRSEATDMLTRMMSSSNQPKRERILIVQGRLDVSKQLRDVLRETKQEVNYDLVTVLSTERAWKILGGKNIHLIILDVTVPSREGQHLLRQIRTNREMKGLPFIIASDDANLVNAAYYSKNGADDILRYPFNPFETPVRLRTALTLFYVWQDSVAVSQSEKYDFTPRGFYRG